MRLSSTKKIATLEAWSNIPYTILCVKALVFCIPVVIAIWHGIDRPFQQEPDANVNWVFQSLLLAEGMHQSGYDHTGFFHLVMMGFWFQFLDFIGVVGASTLSQVQNSAELSAAFNDLVIAARYFSAISVGLLSMAVYSGLRHLTGNGTIAALIAVLFCLSPGVVEQAIRIHTELFSAMFIFVAFFLVVAAARTHGWRGLLWLALAAAFSILSLYAKMQAMPLLLMLPVAALAFGTAVAPRRIDPLVRMDNVSVIGFCMACMAFSAIAVTMIVAQLVTLEEPPVVISPRISLPIFTAYFLLSSLVFTWMHRPHWKPCLMGVCALMAGTATGLYFIFVHDDPRIVRILVNLIDHMTVFSPARDGETFLFQMAPDQSRALLLTTIISNYGDSLFRSFLGGGPGQKNVIIALYWVLAAGMFWALAARKWLLAFQLSLFLGTAISMEAYCRIRSFAPWYYIYVEPWVLFGCAHLFSALISDAPAVNPDRAGNAKQTASVAVMIVVLAVMPLAISDALTDRVYRNDEDICPTISSEARLLPNLTCYERQSTKN
ncbi:MAG: hypothetical protein HQ483_06040 [Rhodospirillales bacterium]|nr:hypothetical protein [Rhodospirillales bacterium]